MNDGILHLCCNFPTFIQKATTDNMTPDGGLTLTKMKRANLDCMYLLCIRRFENGF